MKLLLIALLAPVIAMASAKVEYTSAGASGWSAHSNAVVSGDYTVSFRSGCMLVEPVGNRYPVIYSGEVLKGKGDTVTVSAEVYLQCVNNEWAEVQCGYGPMRVYRNQWQAVSWTAANNSKRIWLYITRVNPGDKIYIRNVTVIRRN